ncbi:MAG: dockerin type I domain-containing protein, partial [Bacteroidota bacterium]
LEFEDYVKPTTIIFNIIVIIILLICSNIDSESLSGQMQYDLNSNLSNSMNAEELKNSQQELIEEYYKRFGDSINPYEIDLNKADSGVLTYLGDCLWSGMNGIVVDSGFAYCSFPSGLEIYDLVDPINPRLISSVQAIGIANGLVKDGDYIYFLEAGMAFINVSNPYSPYREGYYYQGTQIQDVAIKDNYAYLAAGSNRFRIVDISDMSNPVWIGYYVTTGVGINIEIEDNYAYLGTAYGLSIIDFSDPTAPVEISELELNYGTKDIYREDSILFIAWDSNGLRIVNVADKMNPYFVGQYDSLYRRAWGIVNQETLAFIAYGEDGLAVFDISDYEDPTLISYDRYGEYFSDATAIDMDENYIYLGDADYGMRIYDYSDPMNLKLVGEVPKMNRPKQAIINDSLVYIASKGQGLITLDVSDTYNIHEISRYDFSDLTNDLARDKNRIVLSRNLEGATVLDVADPFNPMHALTFKDLDNIQYNRSNLYNNVLAVWTNVTFDTLVDEVNFVDISDPQNPVIAYVMDDHYDYKHVHMQDSIAVIFYKTGFSIYDISDLSNPLFLDEYLGDDVLFPIVTNNRVYLFNEGHFLGFYIAYPDDIRYMGSTWPNWGTEEYFIDDHFLYGGHGIIFEVYELNDARTEYLYYFYPDDYIDDIVANKDMVYVACHNSLKIYKNNFYYHPIFVNPDPILIEEEYSSEDKYVYFYLSYRYRWYENGLEDIDCSTIRINGLIPNDYEFVSGFGDISQDFIKIEIKKADLLISYSTLWDSTYQQFTISGNFINSDAFEERDYVSIYGLKSGDVDFSGKVDITDIVYLINYLYWSGPEPRPFFEIADVNNNNFVNILDCTYLISYLLKNGPAPIHP